MYVCGPTVYDDPHIGRCDHQLFLIFFKLLKNTYSKATYVRNITDIDDKIIQSSQEKNSAKELTNKVTMFWGFSRTKVLLISLKPLNILI